MPKPERAWDILLVLPNVSLGNVSFEGRSFSIRSLDARDTVDRLQVSEPNRICKAIARRYRTVWGARYGMTVLLHQPTAEAPRPSQDDVRTFRDACSISVISHAAARTLSGGHWLPLYSDVFVFSRFTSGQHEGVVSLDGTSKGWWDADDLSRFRGTASETVETPPSFAVRSYDEQLFALLESAQHDATVLDAQRRQQLFRSLAIAFHACRYPSDGLSSLYDFGVRVGLWVSAFETLLNPLTRDALSRHPRVLGFSRVA